MKPKLLFVYDHKYPDKWTDGLWAALNLLDQDFEITRLNLFETDGVTGNNWSFILGWGAFGSSVDTWMQRNFIGYKKGLCIGGNSLPPENADKYDILFCETDYVRDVYLRGIKSKKVKAFGINSDIFFSPDFPTPVVWDYIGVGSFSSWKRWQYMKVKKGSRLIIGEYQRGNEEESLSIVRDLVTSGIMVSDMRSAFDLSNMYQWSRTCFIPADINGGGERAVLEARACGLRVEILEDNPKLKELLTCPIPTHHDYAKALKDGILSVI